jgi:5-methyltetrahydrofolate--homocysteine methyltransferase
LSTRSQRQGARLCLADYFRPLASGERDVLAVQIVTLGPRASEVAHEMFHTDRYEDYLHFHGLAVESAEALAEMWHRHIRIELGIAGDDAKSIEALIQLGYRGCRYSFGYPACPRLEDQTHLFTLLGPERIGLALTEEFELVPEQSTSALVVHHPSATYFGV